MAGSARDSASESIARWNSEIGLLKGKMMDHEDQIRVCQEEWGKEESKVRQELKMKKKENTNEDLW